MTQRVKELIKEEIEYWLDDDTYEFSISTIKSDIQNTLNNILQAHKNEIADKNEYIKFLENRTENHDCKNCPNQQQLYKEDIKIDYICCNDCEEEILGNEIDRNKKNYKWFCTWF